MQMIRLVAENPEAIVKPVVVQLENVNPVFAAFALTFAVMSHESPLPIPPVLNPLLSAVPESIVPPPVAQLVEPMKGCTVTPKVLGFADPGQAADLIFKAPSVKVV